MGLLGVTGVSALCALVGLVFVVIYAIQMNGNIKNVREVSDKIRAINNKRPVPVEENKKPIGDDVAVYDKAVQDIRGYFGHPLTPAVKAFFGTLKPRKSMWIPDGINEEDEVVKRLLALNSDKQLSTLSNAEFDRSVELISAEELIKKLGEQLADEEKAKQIKGLIGGMPVDDPEKLIASAKLDKVLQGSETAKRQAKEFKAAAAAAPAAPAAPEAPAANDAGDASYADDNTAAAPAAPAPKPEQAASPAEEMVKAIRALIPDADKLDEPALANRLAAVELAKKFKTLPANDATAGNVRALIPDADKLTDADLAKKLVDVAALDRKLREIVKDSDPDTLKKMREIPVEIAPDKFLEALKKTMEGVDEKNFADRRTKFDDFIRDKFENWDIARDAFIAAAENRANGQDGPCIVEKLDSSNADEVLLAALGIPRNFSGEARALQQLIDNILGQLEDNQINILGRARGLGILSSGSSDSNGDVNERSVDIQNLNPEDYPAISDHLDIVGYMLYRVGGTKAIIWDVQIRLKDASGGVEGGERRFKDSKEQRDGFDIYHYTLEISGTMKQIRDAVRMLDNCYAVRRVYLVKNISLYAENNIADSIFTGRSAEPDAAAGTTDQQTPAPAEPRESGRRRRPRSKAKPVVTPENSEDPDGSAKDREEQERLDREYEAEQKKLPYYERDGWGERIVAAKEGAETYRAVIDVEYVVKPDK